METGAYTLSGNTGTITVNPGTSVYIPSENEWYRAAYFDGDTSTYSRFPNGQNSITTEDANYNYTVGHSSDVGSYSGDPSFYGTFDQGGNVFEWNDAVFNGSLRGQCGGSWSNLAGYMYSANSSYGVPSIEVNDVGFRVASVAAPSATSFPASTIGGTSATLNGSVNANGGATTVSLQYGLTSSYGATATASPASVTGTSATLVSAALSGLTPGTNYHYRVVATNFGGTTSGADMTFTAGSNNANLAALCLSSGALVPAFDKLTTIYATTVTYATTSVAVTPMTEYSGATVHVNGVPVTTGTASAPFSLPVGNTAITTTVTAEDTITTKAYIITVTRLPETFVFNSSTDVPVTANGFASGGYPVNVLLNYAPIPGTVLTMVNNTGLGFIYGTFGNLAQGQRITLTFNDAPYDFVANYFGGGGNDLVLQWAWTQVASWGSNSYGQLGDTTATGRPMPAPVDATGVLAGKTIIAVSEGYLHSLALCSDGTLAAWGYNVYGQLGNNSAASSSVPVAVDRSGALAGKTVIAISAGPFHNLALCSDGTTVAWGYNNRGQLGDGSTVSRNAPVVIGVFDALKGKIVVGIGAGGAHSLARCADGTLSAWGSNNFGQLGVSSPPQSSTSLKIDMTGIAAGTALAQIAVGGNHGLALCANGTLAAWGDNASGQLGNDSLTQSAVPVGVDLNGLPAGARCMMVASGSAAQHNLAVFGLPSGVTPHAAQLQDLTLDAAGQNAASALIAHAFGMDAPGTGDLPQGKLVGDTYVIEFTQPPGVTGITYGAESSETLLPGSWIEVPDSGTGSDHIFNVSVAGGRLFMRLKVTKQ